MPDTNNLEVPHALVAHSILQYQIDAISHLLKSFPMFRSAVDRALADARNQTLSALRQTNPNAAKVFLSCFDQAGNLIHRADALNAIIAVRRELSD
jgi:hypothetical protein